jgi:hypothetical protein
MGISRARRREISLFASRHVCRSKRERKRRWLAPLEMTVGVVAQLREGTTCRAPTGELRGGTERWRGQEEEMISEGLPFRRRIVGAKAFGVELDLGVAGSGADGVVEVGLGGFGFAFYFPDAGVGEVVGLIGEGSDEGGAEPLDAVVGLSGEVAVV